MSKLFITTLLAVPIFSFGQNNAKRNIDTAVNQQSIAFVKKCIAFIKEVKHQELSETDFILADEPSSIEDFNCQENLLKDKRTFTAEERYFIRNRKYPSLSKWKKDFFKSIKIVSSAVISKAFKDNSGGWKYFKKHIGNDYSTFSVPIFLRNDTWCIFYSDNLCGDLCGTGRLVLYKKEKNHWIEVKVFCDWIS